MIKRFSGNSGGKKLTSGAGLKSLMRSTTSSKQKDSKRISNFVSKERRSKRILANVDEVPSLYVILTQIMGLCNDPGSCAIDFERFISKDYGLTVRLLRLVNSSYFSLPNKINSIHQAVVIIGLKSLKSLVMAASASRLLSRDMRNYGYDSGGLWLHSLATASIAQFLGNSVFSLGNEAADELFVAGLLHDTGKIAILPLLSEFKGEFNAYAEKHEGVSLQAVETAIFGIDHTEVGEVLMQRWKVSDKLVEMIRHHHSDAEGLSNAVFIRVMQLAHSLALQTAHGLGEDYPWFNGNHPDNLLASLGLTCEDQLLLMEKIAGVLQDVNDLSASMK